jgi:hypothetical protein
VRGDALALSYKKKRRAWGRGSSETQHSALAEQRSGSARAVSSGPAALPSPRQADGLFFLLLSSSLMGDQPKAYSDFKVEHHSLWRNKRPYGQMAGTDLYYFICMAACTTLASSR